MNSSNLAIIWGASLSGNSMSSSMNPIDMLFDSSIVHRNELIKILIDDFDEFFCEANYTESSAL